MFTPILNTSTFKDIEAFFDEIIRSNPRTRAADSQRYPKLDMDLLDKKTMRLRFAVPGYSLEELDILYEKGVLQVSAPRLEDTKGSEPIYRELRHAAWTRAIQLDTKKLNPDTIRAELKRGFLDIFVDLRDDIVKENNPRKIKIESHSLDLAPQQQIE